MHRSGLKKKPIFRTKGHGFQRVAIRNSQDFRFNGSALKAVQCQGSVENLAWILTSHTILETKRGLDTGTLPTHLKLKGGFMPSASPQSESATTFVYLKTNPSIFCCEHIFIHMSKSTSLISILLAYAETQASIFERPMPC